MTDRFRLFLVWFVGYVSSLLILSSYCFLMLSVDQIKGILGDAAISLTGVFAPYLTPIVTFWFAKEVVQEASPLAEGPYKVALICSLFYNGLFIVLMGMLFLLKAPEPDFAVTEMLPLANQISTGLAFLVGPAIGFYFGKSD